jgi:quinohemoprotein ethanol dehydrogenase
MSNYRLLIALVALLLQPIACAEKHSRPTLDTTEKRFGDVTEARVLAESDSGENWLVNGGRFSGEHFTPLNQIAADNVAQLGLAWSADIPSFTLVAEPIVVDGVVYLSGALNHVFALDARTGEMLWQFDPEIRLDISQGNSYGSRMNRGVAVWEGRVYVGTGECELIALDAANGKRIWASPVCDPREGFGAHIRGAPRVGDGQVFIGFSGSTSARGALVAFDAATGAETWRFWTVPGDPSKGFETPELERASATWTNGWSALGGGSVWEGIRYDPVTKSVIFGTAAAGPLNPNLRGPGDALFTNCIMAVDAKTGTYKWHYQTVPEDAWDYDAAMPLVVTDLDLPGGAESGGTRRVVMQAPKNGFFYVLDANTGELLAADPIVEVNWASHIDLQTGRPVELPGARYYANEDPEEPVAVKPQAAGAHNWYPMSFSPRTGLVYIPATDLATMYSAKGPAGFHLAAPDGPIPAGSGKLLAWDPVKREIRWSVDYPLPFNGGVVSTAGELVFQGTAAGEFRAYRDTTGELLWSQKTGTSILAAPVSYQIGGEQYVRATAGGGGGNAMITPLQSSTPDAQGPSRLFAFKLGGKEPMPPQPIRGPAPRPPTRTASKAQVAHGEEMWEMCGHCHGSEGIGIGPRRLPGTIPDLRFMSEKSHAEWNAIVLGGSRAAKGMPAFGDSMSVEDSDALHAFVIDRAWKFYESAQPGVDNPPVSSNQNRIHLERKDLMSDYQELLDREELRSLLDRMDNAIDAKDWAKARTFFADEVVLDATSLHPGESASLKADEMIADWARILFEGKTSFHMRYNHDITVDGDTAKVSSKSHSFNVYNTGTGGDMWEVWGIYHHTLRREKDGWKVTGLNYEFVHARGNEKAHEYVPGD